jgi:phospholipid/cholesterol/gamma-HCH transport system ATP-binding protein
VNFSSLDEKGRKEIRKEIGMLFQGSALFDFATVEENIRFPMDFFTDWSNEEKLERVNFCLKRVNLFNVNKLFPNELSGGMQKRVGIARAIALNPKYLFCDEPNSGLDPKTSLLIDELIHDITTEYDMTTIINTHDMNSVMGIGESIIYIYQGRKEWEGTKDEIFTATNKRLNDFIFASDLLKKVRNEEINDISANDVDL